jgi:hypothetical protein
VDPLPMAPSCALDEVAMRSQLERYRQAGRHARLVHRGRRRIVIDLDEHVDREVIEQAIAVERECCPFFAIEWEPGRRRLTVSVAQPEHAPALEAIAYALGIGAPARHTVAD